jgi:hypothetical protein
MTTSRETNWMDHPKLRRLVDEALTLSIEERITLVKGLVPGIADHLSAGEYDTFAEWVRLKGARFLEAKTHPGEGRSTRQVPGERELEGR